jgi:nucleoside-diphosphate-sugar epimerase
LRGLVPSSCTIVSLVALPANHAERSAAEIEKLYDTVQASATNSAPLPKTWQLQDVQPYVLQTVLGVMRPNGGALNDTQDLFLQGCDSLQSTFIRNRLAAGLRQAQFAGVKVPADLVYKAPSIKALSEFLSTAVTLGVAATEDPQVAGKAVEEMVAKYAIAFPAHRGEDGPPRHGSVIITGTTGNLGCYLLHSFASSSEVGRVYALNRAAKIDLQSRQRDALVDRGIDASFLDSEKVELVEADLAQSGMGISQELLSEVRRQRSAQWQTDRPQMGRNVTLIISNAWRLDFNVGLGSFEPNVQSLRNLVDFSLTSRLKTPPRIINISSVSSIGSKPSSGGQPLLEELSETCESSLMGYGRSKHVSERLLAAASSSTGLQTCSVRVGQLSGSRTNGAWNATDWVALLAKSAETLRCLPSSTEVSTVKPRRPG